MHRKGGAVCREYAKTNIRTRTMPLSGVAAPRLTPGVGCVPTHALTTQQPHTSFATQDPNTHDTEDKKRLESKESTHQSIRRPFV